MMKYLAKVVLAFDSFKSSLTAPEACQQAALGLRRVPGIGEIVECPLSDGGEGFAAAMLRAGNGYEKGLMVTGPDFQPTSASLIFLDGGETAVIESAQACGLGLPLLGTRNPADLTSLGVGEMLQASISSGARRLIIGLGGTATNDAGIGMLQALGWRFLAADGAQLPPVGKSLSAITTILPGIPLPAGVEIIAACDVRNPLYGPQGAAEVYGPQKGALPDEVALLDGGLQHFAQLADNICGDNYSACAGAGAAGGLGYALLAFLNARFQPGAELAIELSKLKEHLRGAAFCITGEGCTDGQTAQGKLPAAVLQCCTQMNIPAIVLAGALQSGWQKLYPLGATAILSICQRPQTLAEAITASADAVSDAAEAVGRMMLI